MQSDGLSRAEMERAIADYRVTYNPAGWEKSVAEYGEVCIPFGAVLAIRALCNYIERMHEHVDQIERAREGWKALNEQQHGALTELRGERLDLLHDLDQYRAIVREKDAQAGEMRGWLISNGLLTHIDAAHRPDGTHGPMWLLRKPAAIDGNSLEGWSAESADAAIEDAMREKGDGKS